jgi:hypothetical protein
MELSVDLIVLEETPDKWHMLSVRKSDNVLFDMKRASKMCRESWGRRKE